MRRQFIDDGRWYLTLTIASGGLLAWAPFLHAGQRLQDSRLKRTAAVYAAISAAILGLGAALTAIFWGEPVGGGLSLVGDLSGLVALVVTVVAAIEQSDLRWDVYRSPSASPLFTARPTPSRPSSSPGTATSTIAADDLAVAQRRRSEARGIAMTNPAQAPQLNIGRPDRMFVYDDGGLVDLNTAPADAIVHVCGLGPEKAEELVLARTRSISGFASLEQVLASVAFSERDLGAVREHGIVIPR